MWERKIFVYHVLTCILREAFFSCLFQGVQDQRFDLAHIVGLDSLHPHREGCLKKFVGKTSSGNGFSKTALHQSFAKNRRRRSGEEMIHDIEGQIFQRGQRTVVQEPVDVQHVRFRLIGAGGVFGPGDTIAMSPSPALELGAVSGVSVSAWLKFSAPDDPQDSALIVSPGDEDRSLRLALAAGRLRLVISDDAGERAVEIPAALAFDRWYHVALVVGDQARLYLDGVASATLPAPAAPFGGPVRIGAMPGGIKGFSGTIDELQIANTALANATLKLAASTHVPEAALFTLGEDESYSADEAVGEYLGLMASMFATVRPEGWLILGLLGLMGLLTIDVIVSKSLALSRTETADRRFLALYGEHRPRNRSG